MLPNEKRKKTQVLYRPRVENSVKDFFSVVPESKCICSVPKIITFLTFLQKLTVGLTTTRVQNLKNNEYTKLQFSNEESKLVLTVGKKEFNHFDHQTVFLNPTPEWVSFLF